jgi:hypothetical protein
MVRVVILLALALLGTACTGEDPKTTVDASTSDVQSRTCDGRAYDSCTDTATSSDCMDGLTCRFYGTQNFTICSPLCDASNPCPPDENGMPVNCNQMGRCRASAPNTCTP